MTTLSGSPHGVWATRLNVEVAVISTAMSSAAVTPACATSDWPTAWVTPPAGMPPTSPPRVPLSGSSGTLL
jgi:hypothetical protein